METHRRTFLTSRGITVRLAGAQAVGSQADKADKADTHARPAHGESYTELDLVSGSMHYWRLDRADWRACLTAMKQLGLHIVDTPIPWSVHERRPGQYDWARERDLAAFLDQVARAGMYAIVRPGPLAGGELTHAGLPERLLGRTELLAQTARNTPVWLLEPPRAFPLPSHAATAFQDEVAAWYAAVAQIVAPRMAPDGPVIAVQVGHEAQMLARVGAFDHDYHPDAVRWWHEAGSHDEPPRAWDPDDALRCVAWVQFRETYLARTLTWLGAALDRVGLQGIVRFHALPWTDTSWLHVPGVHAALGANSTAGMSLGPRASDYRACRERALYLAGTAEPCPYAPDVAIGNPAWGVPAAELDQQNAFLCLLSAGARALNVHMAVERDRWYGAPISEVGELRENAPWLQRLLAALADVEWTRLHRDTPVALMTGRADSRFAVASSMAGPLHPMLDTLLGPGARHTAGLGRDPGAIEQRRWVAAVEHALALAQVPYVIVDEHCAVERLARFRAIIMPTLDRVDRATWRQLRELAARGVVVVVGPRVPTRDERNRPLGSEAALPANVGLIREESAGDLDGLADDLLAVAGDLPDVWLTDEQPDVDCSMFADARGAPQVLFVGNRNDAEVTADVVVPRGVVLIDALNDEELAASPDGMVEIALEPGQVRMFLIE